MVEKKNTLKKELAAESRVVRKNSMEILEMFEALEDEIPGL